MVDSTKDKAVTENRLNCVNYAYIGDLTFDEYKKFSDLCADKIAILALGTTTWKDGTVTLNCVVDKRDISEEDINTLMTFLGIAL